MRFKERAVVRSEGWTLAHSVACGTVRIAKGTLVTPVLINRLVTADIKTIQVFLLDEDDLDENTAARLAAEKITGTGLVVELAGRGRANIISTINGLFLPGDGVDTVNAADDAFSAASLTTHSPVRAGQLVATIKLVPYGLPAEKLDNIPCPVPKLTVKPFQTFSATLIVTGDTPTKKTMASLASRIGQVNGQLQTNNPVKHSRETVCSALEQARGGASELILMLGASAISDKRDIFPAGLADAGGELTKLGMPADPGNLLMLGKLGNQTVIGLPGCARSPALNGFDWVLERFAAREPLDAEILSKMGTGGLLKEPAGRKIPRTATMNQQSLGNKTQAAAIVLAAGKSSRAKNVHKLLSHLGSKTVIQTTVDNLLAVKNLKLVTVTGHAAGEIAACLPTHQISIVHNPGFDQGMGTSLAAGIASLDAAITHAFICLGDMPFVRRATIEKILETAVNTNGAAIFVPSFHGKRGHPVLWHQQYFGQLTHLTGDGGGKKILRDNFEKVIEVPVDDPGILIDLDTPEMLAQFGVMPKDQ